MSIRSLAAAAALLVLLHAGAAAAETVRLTFAHVNDVYEIEPGRDGGGLAEMKTVLDTERARAPKLVFSLGGDLLSPSLMSASTKGAHMVRLMAAAGLDVAVLGNHEFDFGADNLRRRIAESPFPWLASNVLDPDDSPFGDGVATWQREIDGITVAYLGVLTEATGNLSAGAADVRFTPALETAARLAGELKRRGADVVVALTHLDLEQDRRLAAQARGTIDLILGGHDHDVYAIAEGDGPLILKAGHDARYLAVAELDVVKEGGKARVHPAGWRMISTRGAVPDAAMAAEVTHWRRQLDADMDRRLAAVRGSLDSTQPGVRKAESSFGNLIADCLRNGLGGDVALINGGGLRADRVYQDGSALTMGDVRREMPFGNVAMLLEVTGADLLAALEQGVSKAPEPSGRFPQISGMTVRYDVARPAGRRVAEVAVGGRPLDPAARYRLATHDYLASGGDGYAMLKTAKRLLDAEAGPLMVTLTADCLAARGEAQAVLDERIRPVR